MTLFPLNPEPASTNEQLALLSKNHPELDSVYLNVHMRDDWTRVKNFLDAEWVKFEKFADPDFASEFQKNFSERAWEIYLFHLLRTNGFNLSLQPRNKPNPDFKIILNDKNLFIEATTARKGEGANKVETTSDMLSKLPSGTIMTRGGHIDDSNHPKVRRILNSLDAKIAKYHDKHKPAIGRNDYYVIAVNGGNIDGHRAAEGLILEAVAGVNPAIHLPRRNDGTFGPAYHTTRIAIPNSSKVSQIDLAVFDQEKFNEVSAVIYFGNDIYNAILQDLSNELVVVHNPNVVDSKGMGLDIFSHFRQIIRVPEGWKYIEPTPQT